MRRRTIDEEGRLFGGNGFENIVERVADYGRIARLWVFGPAFHEHATEGMLISDFIFAVDSIPATFAVTSDPFLVIVKEVSLPHGARPRENFKPVLLIVGVCNPGSGVAAFPIAERKSRDLCGTMKQNAKRLRSHQEIVPGAVRIVLNEPTTQDPNIMFALEDKTFLLLIVAVSAAFAGILWPFFGPVLWGTVLAIVFAPLYRRLVRVVRQKRSIAALVTVFIILIMVILPLTLIVVSLIQEASGVYRRIQTGEINFGRFFEQMVAVLPAWAVKLLERFGLTNFGEVQERLSQALTKGSHFLAAQAINIGQNAFSFLVRLFVMLYLLFFLVRDGDDLFKQIRNAIPLRPEQQHQLFSKFTVVVRATVKGNVVVAILQGTLGGIIFWVLGIDAPLLWGALMAVLSLLPAVGSALVWVPVAVYFLATGSLWRGMVLIAFGVLVIGLVDNIMRPILVGKDTKMPDYVVLISTLGGIAIFGVNGFIIGPLIAAMFIAAWGMLSASKSM